LVRTRTLGRDNARQQYVDSRSFARRTIETERTPQTIGHDVVHDVQPETRAPLIATCREERIKRLVLGIGSGGRSKPTDLQAEQPTKSGKLIGFQ
jgi:hypothetical protein